MEKIRKAGENDKKDVIDCILDAFQKDFSGFINNVGIEKVRNFLEDILNIDCFYIIESEQELIGAMALSDINGRVAYNIKKSAQKHFGFLMGWLIYIVNFREFEINHCESNDTGFIEFVAIKQKFQGKGHAPLLIKNVMNEKKCKKYLLDVVDTNLSAIKCYSRMGFSEVKREKTKFVVLKEFNENIFMEYEMR
ncbi:GNAT family N-acetyltransferase [Streptococcus suis]|uniref:GNAT family N-acetyltransferase n=1 Tax=Streptococcus suis TaxID=1307 RepID=UPI000CF5BBC5|nr:GNAT family N-acetyltransferase [Streptococcus suis]